MADPVHNFFCLTYAKYQVLPRSIMQSMPQAWQTRFVRLMHQIEDECAKRGIRTPEYTVYARDENGRFITDEFRDYQRGRRDVFKEYPIKEKN